MIQGGIAGSSEELRVDNGQRHPNDLDGRDAAMTFDGFVQRYHVNGDCSMDEVSVLWSTSPIYVPAPTENTGDVAVVDNSAPNPRGALGSGRTPTTSDPSGSAWLQPRAIDLYATKVSTPFVSTNNDQAFPGLPTTARHQQPPPALSSAAWVPLRSDAESVSAAAPDLTVLKPAAPSRASKGGRLQKKKKKKVILLGGGSHRRP